MKHNFRFYKTWIDLFQQTTNRFLRYKYLIWKETDINTSPSNIPTPGLIS